MFIDTHMHEMTYSKDSFLTLREIVELGREKGLGGICITDHDSMGLREYAREYSAEVDYPIFTGIEYYSLEGDIVAFGIREYPKERIPAQEFIDMVKGQGGVCFAAHPFRNNDRGLKEHLLKVKGLDGIEVLNGSTSREACGRAGLYADRLGLATLGSSDCHVPEKVGVCATYFPEEVKTEEELLRAFKKGGLKPAYYHDGRYHIVGLERSLVPQYYTR
ncbi:PHP domain-containing protein [Extibacter muris]|uniref:PHP domain-containing protein n=1 Tax=Extibacter muris TaxID=1796622 RepID=UPI001D07D675|nr:PHP domain-containing protein [Extibacter muris]MCB6202435.1 PHP domain-containing protein [Extibacter muris]MCQ4664940.1 PHP domain-containing protein [Extibacter muris]MCQ4694305.1 PHP domain-containing protein [Extibacter muris]